MHSNYINIPISDLKITTLVVLLSEQGGRRMEKYTFEIRDFSVRQIVRPYSKDVRVCEPDLFDNPSFFNCDGREKNLVYTGFHLL